MTNEPSPRPWRAIYARILDAREGTVCVCEKDSMHGMADDETAKADAALIVDAVNERDELKADNLALANGVIENRDRARRLMDERDRLRDERERLRDLVRRFADYCETYHSLGVQGKTLVSKARAALGEGETPTGKGAEG